jgi:hypothetical protein
MIASGRAHKLRAAREKYEAGQAERKGLEAELAGVGKVRPAGTIEAELAAKKLDARYKRSKDCIDATVADNRALCAEIAALEGEKANAARPISCGPSLKLPKGACADLMSPRPSAPPIRKRHNSLHLQA